MSFIKSIRWRLPLTYAGIALFTAAALGGLLLTTVRSYYERQELMYLQANALEISGIVQSALQAGIPLADLESSLLTFGFLARTRIELLDEHQRMLVDTGTPAAVQDITIDFTDDAARLPLFGLLPSVARLDDVTAVSAAPAAVIPVPTATTMTMRPLPAISVDSGIIYYTCDASAPANECSNWEGAGEQPMDATIMEGRQVFFSVSPNLYGFTFDTPIESSYRRSNLHVEAAVMMNADGTQRGTVRLSEGPAYGSEIVDGVAVAGSVAGLIAVLLAAFVGWIISQRINAPLLALTRVTARMAQGDLTARAQSAAEHEIGVLTQTFNEMADKIEDTIRVLRRFVADAAHEIHTPLTALRTNLELANSETENKDYRRYIERAHEQAARLQGLTDSLLQLSRLETRADDLIHEALDIGMLVRSVSEFYASRAEQADVAFEIDVPAVPLWAQANEGQIRTILDNLLDNALKFTPPGGTVCVRVTQTGSALHLQVADTGIGIPSSDLELIFDRFRRGRNAAAYAGSGLGLAIVKAIVERYRGKIQVASSERGTQITVLLPAESTT